ncbi:aminoacyl-tRNA hydrolase [Nocardioidaceae bacterium SCSIO 66511]|nr:aminoacyl-tRNA hydrolase [Nocardioidaceae bacterium SCSIO 66511]
MSDAWLIVGLGNPGPKYAPTRHNVGYLVVDELVDRVGGSLRSHKSGRAEVAEVRLGGIPGVRAVLMRARAYMNESGGPVSSIAKFYEIPAERVIAIHDELDIDFGRLRVKYAGGDNGHNGLRSMRQSLGTGDFFRVRFGIGRPPGRQPAADFVLRPFAGEERKTLPLEVDRAADAAESLILRGLADTQSEFNG